MAVSMGWPLPVDRWPSESPFPTIDDPDEATRRNPAPELGQ